MEKQKHYVCSFCRNPNSPSAEWLVSSVSGTDRVHKPCGENAVAHAPEGLKAKVFPSRELRARWEAEKSAKAFWKERFSEAKVAKDRKNPPPQPARLSALPLAAK